jgi:excisionase family DNA binding protein
MAGSHAKKPLNQDSPALRRIAQLLARQAASEKRQDIGTAEADDLQRGAYVRAADIARLLNVDIRTVRRRIKDQTIPSVRVGGARLVAIADLERLLQQNLGPTADPEKQE